MSDLDLFEDDLQLAQDLSSHSNCVGLPLRFKKLSLPASTKIANAAFGSKCKLTQYDRPIFQQVYTELALRESLGICNNLTLHKKHIYFLTRLLKKAVMKRDYIEAAYILSSLVFCPSILSEQLWRAGLEVLSGWRQPKGGNVVNYSTMMYNLCYFDRTEISLALAFYFLQNNKDVHQSYQFLTDKISNCIDDPLFRAFIGVFEYVFWKTEFLRTQFKHTMNNSDDELSDDNFQKDASKDKIQLMYYGQKAMKNFDVIKCKSGILDIFILKNIELLHYFGKDAQATNILLDYRNKHSDNPNAHRYYYWFLKGTGGDRQEILTALITASQKYPSTKMGKDLLVLLRKDGDVSTRLQLLFDRLDFASNRNSFTDWDELHTILSTTPRGIVGEKVKELWETRQDWWPEFHLKGISFQRTDRHPTAELMALKGKVIAHLEFYSSKATMTELSGKRKRNESLTPLSFDFRLAKQRKESTTP